MYCQRCGQQNPDNYTYCVSCAAPKNAQSRLLTTPEVADLLVVSTTWVKKHCTTDSPILPHIRLGDGERITRRFRLEDVLQLIQSTAPNEANGRFGKSNLRFRIAKGLKNIARLHVLLPGVEHGQQALSNLFGRDILHACVVKF